MGKLFIRCWSCRSLYSVRFPTKAKKGVREKALDKLASRKCPHCHKKKGNNNLHELFYSINKGKVNNIIFNREKD